MSLLLEAGHPHASRYPIATLWAEARYVRERYALRRKLDVSLMQGTLASLFSAKAGKDLRKLINKLDEAE